MDFLSQFARRALILTTAVFMTLVVPVCLTLGSVRLLMTSGYLQIEYNKADFPPDEFGFTLADRVHYAPYAVEYLVSGPDDELSALTFADGRPFYNNRELEHMADVRRVTRTAFAIGVLILIAALIVAVWLNRSEDGKTILRASLLRGGLLTIIAIIGLGVGVLVAWDSFFTQFHQLFFESGTWQFAYSDSLIRLFPVRFWQDAALTIGGLNLFGALVIVGLCFAWGRQATNTKRGKG